MTIQEAISHVADFGDLTRAEAGDVMRQLMRGEGSDAQLGALLVALRMKGETVKAINNGFPHWFCRNYEKFNDNENAMPVDQHMLVALMAPRPVYVASAAEDNWADPEGEFLSCVHAGPVYELFGKKGVRAKRMPKVDRPLQKGSIAYHVRSGKHNLTEYDWDQFIRFADKRMR